MCCLVWGNVGLEVFDEQRKLFMGFSTVVTIIAMCAMACGCVALSVDRQAVVGRSYAMSIPFIHRTFTATPER